MYATVCMSRRLAIRGIMTRSSREVGSPAITTMCGRSSYSKQQADW